MLKDKNNANTETVLWRKRKMLNSAKTTASISADGINVARTIPIITDKNIIKKKRCFIFKLWNLHILTEDLKGARLF